jgi:hypothetical protein
MKLRGAASLVIVTAMAGQAAIGNMQQLIDNRVNTAKKAVGIVVGTIDASGTHIYSAGETSLGTGQKPDGNK